MVKVKICGLKTLTDVEIANRYLPEYIGFVFANTRRFVTDEQAFAMRQALDGRIKAVGVFVDEPMEHVIEFCEKGIIDAAQLHGDETDDYIRTLKQKTGTTAIKAVRVRDVRQVIGCMSEEADFMLFDTYKKGEPGGTGERFELGILHESLARLKAEGKRIKPYFIAGGLDCGNVAEIIAKVGGCIAVDVSTGVETDGAKDAEKIRRFIEIVRNL